MQKCVCMGKRGVNVCVQVGFCKAKGKGHLFCLHQKAQDTEGKNHLSHGRGRGWWHHSIHAKITHHLLAGRRQVVEGEAW